MTSSPLESSFSGTAVPSPPRGGASAPRHIPALTSEQYATLVRLARALHWRSPSWTTNPTALVHEALIKVHGWPDLPPSDDPRFMALAARAMRQLLVDAVRKKLKVKHGGGLRFVPLTDPAARATLTPGEFLDLNRALDDLAAMNQRHALAVEYVNFFGYTVEEAATLLKVAPKTVQRDLRAANAWLACRVADSRAVNSRVIISRIAISKEKRLHG